ncbi:hypothetical protein HerbRD11066_18280 [Herbidospora sp. RD11066]
MQVVEHAQGELQLIESERWRAVSRGLKMGDIRHLSYTIRVGASTSRKIWTDVNKFS